MVTELRVRSTERADLVGISPAGAIALVECKLLRNDAIRRGVVGQLLDYAAGISGLSYSCFDRRFKDRERRNLTAAVREIAGDEWDEVAFAAELTENLKRGRFDLVIATDRITDELTSVVKYLDQRTTPEIRLQALPWPSGEEVISGGPHSARRSWHEGLFFDTLEQEFPEGVEAIQRLYDDADARYVFGWDGGSSPSLTAYLTDGAVRVAVAWRCSTGPSASWRLRFPRVPRRSGARRERMRQILEPLRELPGVTAQLDRVEQEGRRRQPSIPVSLLTAPQAADVIAGVVEDLASWELGSVPARTATGKRRAPAPPPVARPPWDEYSLRRLAKLGNNATITMLDLCAAEGTPQVHISEIADQLTIKVSQVRAQLAWLTIHLRKRSYGLRQRTWPVDSERRPDATTAYTMSPELAQTWREIRAEAH